MHAFVRWLFQQAKLTAPPKIYTRNSQDTAREHHVILQIIQASSMSNEPNLRILAKCDKCQAQVDEYIFATSTPVSGNCSACGGHMTLETIAIQPSYWCNGKIYHHPADLPEHGDVYRRVNIPRSKLVAFLIGNFHESTCGGIEVEETENRDVPGDII